jgi:hypothetical protein
LHQIKKLLHSKGNSYQREKPAHKMGEVFSTYSLDKGLIFWIYKDLKN